MKRASLNTLKIILSFTGMGAIAGAVLLVITSTADAENRWYFSFEYWISPTYLNFTLAAILTVFAFCLSSIVLVRKRLIVASVAGNSIRKIGALAIIAISHRILFWIHSDMSYPASLFLATFLLALSVSLSLWVLSGYLSISTSSLILVCFLLAPNIPVVLRIQEAEKFVVPTTIPLLLGLCGYWLATAESSLAINRARSDKHGGSVPEVHSIVSGCSR